MDQHQQPTHYLARTPLRQQLIYSILAQQIFNYYRSYQKINVHNKYIYINIYITNTLIKGLKKLMTLYYTVNNTGTRVAHLKWFDAITSFFHCDLAIVSKQLTIYQQIQQIKWVRN